MNVVGRWLPLLRDKNADAAHVVYTRGINLDSHLERI